MEFIIGYLKSCYPTFLILVAITLVVLVNRGAKIQKIGLIYIMTIFTFILSLLEYSEKWIDANNLSCLLLYYKAMLIYWLYPALTMILMFVICDVKYRAFIAIPQMVNMIITAIDVTGTGFVYRYSTGHAWHGGPLRYLPFAVEDFYVFLIAFFSIKLLRGKNKSKGIIVGFIVATLLIGEYLLIRQGMDSIHVPVVLAVITFTYYFYLAGIQHLETREELNESLLALERNRCNLLLAQIRPHFINSNLAVIRSLCYEDPEKAVEMIDHFSGYLRENIKQIDDMQLVPFEKEMESVDNYLYLECQRFPDRIEVIRDIRTTGFYVPSLAVQTIVENAIRHGISMKGVKGTIRIATEELDEEFTIKVEDDGKGFDVAGMDPDGVHHVGIKNVRDRFERILGGKVVVESTVGKGTVVTFHIPAKTGSRSLQESHRSRGSHL